MFWENSQKQILKVGLLKRFGSEFYVDRPATRNARLPYVMHHCGCTVSWWLAAERMCCRDAVSETGALFTARYCGSVPSWHWCIIMQSLYLTHSGTSSQWRSACSTCVRPRSNFFIPLTTQAAAFNTRCSLLVTDFRAPTKTTLQ